MKRFRTASASIFVLNLVLATRYGANNWALGRDNIAFSATLYPVAVGLIYLYERAIG